MNLQLPLTRELGESRCRPPDPQRPAGVAAFPFATAPAWSQLRQPPRIPPQEKCPARGALPWRLFRLAGLAMVRNLPLRAGGRLLTGRGKVWLALVGHRLTRLRRTWHATISRIRVSRCRGLPASGLSGDHCLHASFRQRTGLRPTQMRAQLNGSPEGAPD